MKQIELYNDTALQAKIRQHGSKMLEIVPKMVEKFNSLPCDDLRPDELQELICNPKAIYEQRLEQIEVPTTLKHVKKSKYVELLDIVQLSELMEIQSQMMPPPAIAGNGFILQNFAICFELKPDGMVNLLENVVNDALCSRCHRVVTENDRHFATIEKVQEIINLINELPDPLRATQLNRNFLLDFCGDNGRPMNPGKLELDGRKIEVVLAKLATFRD